MIIDLPSTTSSKINRALVDLREKGGSIALGRVLTLVIVTEESDSEDPIAAANAASFEHPCRVIVLARGVRRASARMDAQIRVGGDAGASEVIVLRLYGPLVDHGESVVVPLLLADAPVVAWWPGEAPAVPADDPIGMLAQRRITDAASAKRPISQLGKRAESYRPGDTDLAWTRITRWRGLLASTLDQPPHDRVLSATVSGAADSPSADLLAGWLAVSLKCPVRRAKSPAKAGAGVHSVVLTRRAGDISLVRPETITAELIVANQPERHVALPRRGLRDCLAEELRRLDADEVYADVLSRGLALIGKQASADGPGTGSPRTAAAGSARSGAARSGGTRRSAAPKSDPKSGRATSRRSARTSVPTVAAEATSTTSPTSVASRAAETDGATTAAKLAPARRSRGGGAMASVAGRAGSNGGAAAGGSRADKPRATSTTSSGKGARRGGSRGTGAS